MFRTLQPQNPEGEQDPTRDPAVLFISHDASRTGAPLALLRLLRWIRDHSSLKFGVLFRSPEGSLLEEFEKLAPVWIWKEDFDFSSLQRRERFDVVYSNTITNGAVLEQLAAFRLPVVTHVHELEFWIRHRVEQLTLQHTLQYTTTFVAVSRACERVLTETLGIAKERVRVISEFVDTEEFCRTARADKVREDLAIPPEAFVIGACGTTDWRKGPDLFIQLAALISKRCAVPPCTLSG